MEVWLCFFPIILDHFSEGVSSCIQPTIKEIGKENILEVCGCGLLAVGVLYTSSCSVTTVQEALTRGSTSVISWPRPI